ncbi:ADP-ribosylglycohydrolase family protein [Pseudomonas sp. GNP014]
MPNTRLKRTISSALWSAYADALGFPTELANEKVVIQRLGKSKATRTEQWNRQVGGRFGAMIALPAGAYSDDTQLRLATCRAIRGNGYFDVESFAKIELPVWQAYSLGAGRGSKAAATALSNRSNTWFSNFFSGYTDGGGNGAAMRIQPHVWAAENLRDFDAFIPDVIRNAVCTHGHMRGIAGAVVHAASLALVMSNERVVSPDQWYGLASYIRAIPDQIAQDSDLATFWLPTWEQKSKKSLMASVEEVAVEWESASSNVLDILKREQASSVKDVYECVVKAENGLSKDERGSGLKCALFANVAAWLASLSGAQDVINVVVNLLDSDTDTIATMSGALIGAAYPDAVFLGDVQDEKYIRSEAERLYDVSCGIKADSYSYPDILFWQAPRVALDVMRLDGGKFYFEAFGYVKPIGQPYTGIQKNSSWQWLMLETGQTILSKFRTQIAKNLELSLGDEPVRIESLKRTGAKNFELFHKDEVGADVFSGAEDNIAFANAGPLTSFDSDKSEAESALNLGEKNQAAVGGVFVPPDDGWILHYEPSIPRGMDILTSEAIKNFDPLLIGQHLLYLAERPNGIELSAVYAGIIAKAKIARLNRDKQKTNAKADELSN